VNRHAAIESSNRPARQQKSPIWEGVLRFLKLPCLTHPEKKPPQLICPV
jgi:hypothetical protein